MKRLLTSAAAAALISAACLAPGQAAAADLVAVPPPPVEELRPTIAYDWSGAYFGVHGGWGWGNVEGDDDDFDGDGDVDLFEVVALRLELGGHGVEGRGERAQVAGGAAGRHADVEIAARDLLRGADQPADWRDKAPGKAQPDPYRGEHHDQRHADEEDGENDLHTEPGNDLTGPLLGAQLGVNYQWNWLVLGAEGDATWSFMDSDDDDLFDDDDDDFDRIGVDAEVDWLASIRGRVGLAADRFMIYGTGGVAWAGFSHEFDDDADFFDDDDDGHGSETGWVFGGGAEWLAWRARSRRDNVTVGAEYLHYEFSDIADIPGDGGEIDADVDVFRLRANWKYGGLFGG